MTRIHFNEVVTRDGFQNEPAFVPTDAKVALVDELSACGYAKVQVTSFTSAKAIPMLRDAEEVMGRIRRVPGVETTVLVPNVRGAERALASTESAPVRQALQRLLDAHDPNPALALDRHWNLVAHNRMASLLLQAVSPALLQAIEAVK